MTLPMITELGALDYFTVSTVGFKVLFVRIVLAHDVVALDDALRLEPIAKPPAELAQYVTPYVLL
jgi:hypothetical protein